MLLLVEVAVIWLDLAVSFRPSSPQQLFVSIIGKSIPVHCVVMNTTTPCYLSDATISSSCGGGGGGAGLDGGIGSNKEEAAAGGASSASDEVEVDSYAIIPASTLFTHIVPTVLRKLGYSDDIIFSANGTYDDHVTTSSSSSSRLAFFSFLFFSFLR